MVENTGASVRELSDYRIQHNLPKRKVKAPIIAESDPEWKESLKNHWWESENIQSSDMFLKNRETKESDYEDFYFLHKVLLSIGGSETCLPPVEEDMKAILDRGRFFGGRSRMMKGKPSQCHRNSCELWRLNHEDHNVQICTGYALSEDGMWRQHSWLLLQDMNNQETVIETTKKRKAYFGFVMTEDEALDFVSANY